MRPNFRQIDEAVDLAQEVIVRDMTLKAEAVDSASCITRRSPMWPLRPPLPKMCSGQALRGGERQLRV